VHVVRATDLEGVPLFDGLEGGQLAELARWFEKRSVDSGTCLTGEGTPGYSFYVLANGTAEVTSGETTIATLGPGDFFGEVALLGDGRRSATVTTTTPSTVLTMFGTEFRRLSDAQPAIAARITSVMRARVRAA
jgi:CRP/FNR family transcriptional regulator, cyclic AMP receptor protein